MSNSFVNFVYRAAAQVDGASGQTRVGIVTSYDPVQHAARVMIQPEGVLSGWLPISSQWIGNGWGLVASLTPGDQVVVTPQEGAAEQGIITGRLYSTAQQPPQPQNAPNGSATPVQAGELAMVHQSGATIRLCADGTIYLQASTINVQGNIAVTGSITATQNITAGEGGGDQIDLLNHTHLYTPGTGTPTQTAKPTAGT